MSPVGWMPDRMRGTGSSDQAAGVGSRGDATSDRPWPCRCGTPPSVGDGGEDAAPLAVRDLVHGERGVGGVAVLVEGLRAGGAGEVGGAADGVDEGGSG